MWGGEGWRGLLRGLVVCRLIMCRGLFDVSLLFYKKRKEVETKELEKKTHRRNGRRKRSKNFHNTKLIGQIY